MTTDTNYIASDSVDVVRRRRPGDRRDSLAWLPVSLRESDLEPFVRIDGEWHSVNGLIGFERYEKVRPRKRKLYDTARNRMVEVITTPASPPRVRCHPLHIERAQHGFTMCVDCRRPLFPSPKNKCRAHSVYCCRDCFAAEAIAEFTAQRNA